MSGWAPHTIGRIREGCTEVLVLGGIIGCRTPKGWFPECEDTMVEGDPDVGEQAEHRVPLDDQVLKEGNELPLLSLASERSPRSQVTGWRRTSRRVA